MKTLRICMIVCTVSLLIIAILMIAGVIPENRIFDRVLNAAGAISMILLMIFFRKKEE